MGLVVVTPPAEEPIDVNFCKEGLRVTNNAQDMFIEFLIKSSRKLMENFLNQTLVTTTYDLTLDHFPDSRVILLPKSPVQSITYVKYIDSGGTLQTLDSSNYKLDSASIPARLTESASGSFPTHRCETNAITIRYVAGYGDAEDVPEYYGLSILQIVSHGYVNREAVMAGNSKILELAAMNVIKSHRVWGF